MHYSQRLGEITDAQLQAALDRFGLGTLAAAAPIADGLFGQNLFLTSATAEYVLRGYAHYFWQFPQEQHFARLIHERTTVPAPRPYQIDESREIFGWSYAIMPRLPGAQIGAAEVRGTFTPQDRIAIAAAMGDALGRLQALTFEHPAAWDPDSAALQPMAYGWAAWIIDRVRKLVLDCRKASASTTTDDVLWIESLIDNAREALAVPFTPVFVHEDYKENNCVAERQPDGSWSITGIFDLMTAFAGDGEIDLMRSAAGYLHAGRPALDAFLGAYRALRPQRPGFAERWPLYMVAERLLIWEYGQRKEVWFTPEQTFRSWAERYCSL